MIRSKRGVNDANPMYRARSIQSALRMGCYDMGDIGDFGTLYGVLYGVQNTGFAEPNSQVGGRVSHGGEGDGKFRGREGKVTFGFFCFVGTHFHSF